MKTQTKKILLGLGLGLLGSFAVQAQGLQNIRVEKYYITNAADAANASAQGAVSALNPGSIVYRVYVDMAPGYKLNAVYGDPNHAWNITTTTNFYNDPNYGVATGPEGISLINASKHTAMIDSWLSMGGACAGKVGVLESEDTDGTIGNNQGVLANNPGGVYGAPITGVGGIDGLAAFTPTPTSNVGLPTSLNIFNQTVGNTFSTNGGSIYDLTGVVGTTTSNAVLIGQFTTDGVFGFELNVQVQATGSLVAENWVANNPQPGEFTLGALTLAPPTVSITAPLNGANVITGNVVSIAASAASAGGTITSVDFRVDGISVGTDVTAPYTASYTSVSGNHTITAIATDNNSLTATSSQVIITAAANQAPLVNVSAPLGPIVAPGVVTFSANAVDLDGTVSSLTLFVNNVAIGTSTNAGPAYTFTWTSVAGLNQNVTASATDNLGAIGTSSAVVFNVTANTPPSVAINTPANNSSVIAPQVVTITATATDPGGSIALVEAFVNNVSIGSYTTSGPNYTWTYATSTLTTLDVIKVVATDNAAATTTSSPVNVNVGNPNGNPYKIGAVNQQCNQGNFCLPITAGLSYTTANVIGYDFILSYNPAKVTPSGIVTVNNYINPIYVQIAEDHTTTPGTMYVSASLAGSTPTNVVWNLTVGGGTLFCVDFNKIGANFAAVETTTFGISSLQESYFTTVKTPITDPGSYTTYRDTLFDGQLKFWADASAMGYTNAAVGLVTNVYGTSTLCVPTNTAISVQPSTAGGFTYNIVNGGNINITRDINNNTSVQLAINNGDQTIARNVLLNQATGTLQPTVYQMIALDVNMDGLISSGDLTQINQRAIDAIGEYKQAWNYDAAGTKTLTGFGSESKDWIFVDSVRIQTNSAYQISNSWPFVGTNGGFYKGSVPSTPFCLTVPQSSTASCPTINNETFYGIMLGDATGNFSALSSTLQLRPSSTSDKVVIDLEKSIVNGNSIEVPVSFVSSKPVYGLDFAMKFDESSLTYNTMVNFPSTTDAMAYFNPNSKTLRFTCTNVNAAILPAGQPVASIRFETKNGVVDADQFNSLLGILNGEQVAIEVLSRTVGINNAANSDNAVSIFPNPTNGILNITSIGDATVQLFDVTGKEVLSQTSVNASKTQQINVSGLVNGVYIIKVSNNDFVTIKKVVLNK